MKKYLALFFTHSSAIKFNRFARKNNIECDLMPVPRKLSSNCGICAKFSYEKPIDEIKSLDIEKIYEVERNSYTLIYED